MFLPPKGDKLIFVKVLPARIPILDIPIPVSHKDHRGEMSATFYIPPTVCNLNCYGCHNRAMFNPKGAKFMTVEKLVGKIRQLNLLGVRWFIISGGEPSLYKHLELLLGLVRKHFKGFIRLDTNGTKPDKVKTLFEHGLIDAVAVDIKIPLRNVYKKSYCEILFSTKVGKYCKNSEKTLSDYRKNLRKTAEVAENYSENNLYRTVLYPLFDTEDVKLLEEDLKSLGISEKHSFNPFVSPEELTL